MTKEAKKDCVFCKIAAGDIPAQMLHKDKDIAAFYDQHPIAPVHVLIIPVKHIPSLVDFKPGDENIAGKLIMTAKKIADDLELSGKGYKLLLRVGKHGGQEVEHIHLHLLGGAPLSENIHPL